MDFSFASYTYPNNIFFVLGSDGKLWKEYNKYNNTSYPREHVGSR